MFLLNLLVWSLTYDLLFVGGVATISPDCGGSSSNATAIYVSYESQEENPIS